MPKVLLKTFDAAHLREIIDYNPETGFLTWKKRKRGTPFGRPAGSRSPSGYVVMQVEKKMYAAHRLCWLHHHGYWPTMFIDHINGVKWDNRICNLREANHRQNGFNKKPKHNSASGIKGVSWSSHDKKWRAAISIDGKLKNLGTFGTIEDAAAKYREYEDLVHGEFKWRRGLDDLTRN